VIAELRARVAAVKAENADFKRRLGMTSANSSKPPSSDSPFTKPSPKSLRRTSGRKPGGQPGHPGFDGGAVGAGGDPNERQRHEPGPCTGCGASLVDAPEVGMERRQVFDLPPMTVRVTEHQLIARRSACRQDPPHSARRLMYQREAPHHERHRRWRPLAPSAWCPFAGRGPVP
jgi:hypothetical protein